MFLVAVVMEEKERYEKIYFDNKTSFKIIDNITEQNVGSIDNIIRLLNRQDKLIKHLNNIISEIDVDFTIKQYNELKKENQKLKQQFAITEKAFDYAIFELDFARNHSQATNSETFKRIDKLRNKILNKAKEMLENE